MYNGYAYNGYRFFEFIYKVILKGFNTVYIYINALYKVDVPQALY